MDQLYYSISLANWLIEKNIICVGILNNNCVGIPVELKDPKNREEFSTTLYFENDYKGLALCTYTVKTKSPGKKTILILSAMQPLPGITKDGN